MKKILLSLFVVSALLVTVGFVSAAGFDQYGYNNNARVFVGTCHSWYLGKLGGTDAQASAYCGVYDNDKLVMKWNAAWDACNAAGNNDAQACTGAWVDNEWNGMKNGSGENWHYKIVWVGDYAADPSLIPDGAYGVWGEYATLMDQGKDPNVGSGHIWYANATPNGYGAY